MRVIPILCLLIILPLLTSCEVGSPNDRKCVQWESIDWSIQIADWEGNPYDLMAAVAFVHEMTGERKFSHMFYAGGNTWAFRFTPTQPGTWTFLSLSDDPELIGISGKVQVSANPEGRGFVTAIGRQWGWSGTGQVFVPQLAMGADVALYAQDSARLDRDIRVFIGEHGFNGLHVYVNCRWFDLEKDRSDEIDNDNPNPNPATFEVLEQIIRKTYAAGGMVHLWAWGDEQRTQTPIKWGINGPADKRLQRYIAARLGPLPGWTMGYGFDLWEWVTGEQLTEWHGFMHEVFGWPHMLGARSSKNTLEQLSEDLDYSSYEQHRPDYDKYVETIERRPGKPSFSEDRFRIRQSEQYVFKDYDLDMTRRGLWHSTMVGGVANIWGHLEYERPSTEGSLPYPNADQIQTWSRFFASRFVPGMKMNNDRTDGACLQSADGQSLTFYKENTEAISMSLQGVKGTAKAVAVDTKQPYVEIEIGQLQPEEQVWTAPYESDWAVAVGDYKQNKQK